MKHSIKQWIKSGDYLPKPLKDFHDQKEVFKRISEMRWTHHEPMPDWVTAHIFVIDYFLWFMAMHGYKLQKVHSSRFEGDFYDLEETIPRFREERIAAIREAPVNKN